MMESLKNLFDNLKEKFKAAWAEQMESEVVIRLRERFDELPSLGQKAILTLSVLFGALILLWWPLSNLMDANDFNSKFDDHRELLKELQQVQRDIVSGPNPPFSTAPVNLKGQFDQKLSAGGVKPDQIKESVATPTRSVSGVDERGYVYQIQKLTIRQAVDLGYELEHSDPNLKLLDLKIVNNNPDPHYYDVTFKLVSYAAKAADIPSSGGGIIDSLKNKNQSPKPENIPNPNAPSSL
jgi:hypothetical protein